MKIKGQMNKGHIGVLFCYNESRKLDDEEEDDDTDESANYLT